MNALLPLAGAAIILVTVADVFFTVLFPASGHGPIRKPLARAVWHLFRLAGKATAGSRRRNVLSYSGPILIAVTLSVWFLLMVLGWAMIYRPAVGTAITASSGQTEVSWATALYYSGFTFTTLGVGDVVATTATYRLLTILEAGMGFAYFTMVITYFLSVYSNLVARNTFAQEVHHLTGRTDDAAELLARVSDGGDLTEVRQQLLSRAEPLRQIYQSHRAYPVLRFFHYREPHYALPRVLLTVLDAATLMRTVLDGGRYGTVLNSSHLSQLLDASTELLIELGSGLAHGAPSADQLARWRRQYARAAARIADAGLQVRTDLEIGAEEYVALRSDWDPTLRSLATLMLYEWDAIERDPRPPQSRGEAGHS